MGKKKSKKKTLSPEEQEIAFAAWKETEDGEWALLQDLYKVGVKFQLLGEIEGYSTVSDLEKKMEEFMQLVSKIGKVFKVKGCKKKFKKPITQMHIRTAFFGGDRERAEAFTIDGQKHLFELKAPNGIARDLKVALIAIMNIIVDSHHLEDFTAENYLDLKKKMQVAFKDFYKNYKLHIKKGGGNALTLEMLKSLIAPLEVVMENNMRLTVLDFSFKDQDSYDVHDFQYKALIVNFCQSYQKLQALFLKYPEGPYNLKDNLLIFKDDPDIYSVLKKFQYDGWRKNYVERFYIQPLFDRFLLLRADLTKLYSMGFEFWKVPLCNNITIFKDMNNLIDQEIIVEEILGDRLKREQLNFMFESFSSLYEGLARKKLVKKTGKIMNYAIPKLIALKTLMRINAIFEKKFVEETEGQKFKRHEIESPEPLIEFALISAKNPKEKYTHQELLPPGKSYKETMKLANKEEEITIVMDDNDLSELDKYGRFFMWPDYVEEKLHDEIIEHSKLLRTINHAVLQDFEDKIINEGMLSSNLENKKKPGKLVFNCRGVEVE